jgi:RimJ/RimL family protein N-acetyltransferase
MTNSIDTLATPRLLAEAITPAHFSDLSGLLTDPLVMKTLSTGGKPLAEDAIRTLIEQIVEHWRRHGFGFWAFHRLSDSQFIGRGGLKIYEIDGQPVTGLAYAVMSDHWGQGYATEIARASIDVGFRHLELPEVCSWTLPVNRASQRVMEKLGFRHERDFEFAGLEHRFYRLARGEWKRYDGGKRGLAN